MQQILSEVGDNDHHFGRPFLTAYQLAIEFDRRHHNIAQLLNKQVGGAGIGVYTSLAQYLANELSRFIKNDSSYPVEGAFISNRYETNLSYTYDNKPIVSSLTGTGFSLSMFRLRA